MPSHSWDDLYKTLRKGALPAAVYLHGTEEPLKDEATRALLDHALEPGLRDFNLDTRSAATLDADDVHTLLTTLPMMAERRVVVIRDVESWNKRAKAKQAVLRGLEKPAPETLLVLVQGAGDGDDDLVRRCYAVDCARLPPERALAWVRREADRLGLDLAPEAMDHMVKVWDAELGPLQAELAKLSGLAGGGPISLEGVSQFLGVRHGETIPDWRDAVMAGETGRATTMLPRLLEQSGVSGVKLVTLLGQALVGAALARALRDEGKRGRALESAVFDALRRIRLWGLDYRTTAAAWSRWSEHWTAPRLREALARTSRADQALKQTTVSGEAGILTDLVIGLADQRQAAA